MKLLGVVGLAVFSLSALAQSAPADPPPTLLEEIAAADGKLFDAFNARDLETVATMFDRDLEFFHDQGGLAGYDQTIRQLAENFERPASPRRELVDGTMEVHPIPNYGAIQVASHRFCHEENGRTECGVFKFVHVWQKKDGAWKITRVVSYDH
jgi:ketosteroid isomerase-like protein